MASKGIFDHTQFLKPSPTPPPSAQYHELPLVPMYIVGDVENAFLQIELDSADRAAIRVIYKPRNSPEKHYRFCRVPFGGESSLFVLGELSSII